jgi:hypothetical protein
LIEVPLLRLGKRLDAVLLVPGIVAVIEFKIGATRYDSSDKAQTEAYAHSLRDFHEASQRRLVVPILCAEKAADRPIEMAATDGVVDLILANGRSLGRAFAALALLIDHNADPLDAIGFDLSPYRPTPTIIEAAQALYAGHEIADIGRGDAGDAELQAAASALQTNRSASGNGTPTHHLFRDLRPWRGKDAARLGPRAEESFDKAIRLSPRDDNLGLWFSGKTWSYFGLKQYDLAFDWARQATAVRASDPGPYQILAAALALTRHEAEAREALQTISCTAYQRPDDRGGEGAQRAI